ncbi:MAG: hypothetical protein AAFQ43_08560, partial [Bacteroidota bacterium]
MRDRGIRASAHSSIPYPPSLLTHYDLCIIGAGVGGGALAHALAPTGKKILLLNRLGSLPREADNWDPEKLFVDGK